MPELGGSEGYIREGMRMTSARRTLSIHQEHDLLVRLESVGLNASMAQFVIDSRGNLMAKRITSLIQTAMQEELPPRPATTNGYNFTERIRKVLFLANEEACKLKHEYVGTEHILLGLIAEGEGVGATIIRGLGYKLEKIKKATLDRLKEGKAFKPVDPTKLPYTSRSKKVLELSMDEARFLGYSWVGTEHLLLGLIREEKGIAAQVLLDQGILLEYARIELNRLVPPAREPAR